MKRFDLLGASVLALFAAAPAFSQNTAPQADEAEDVGAGDIIVTAQRQAQSLQDVPIAVSAFSAEALEKQQIENASDLQLTLPNVVFSKGNFTGSSFTIRGIGDLCVGNTCDSATGIHVNGTPLLGTRLFETEYFDLERIEVLRGPQGTLFGRNATSGVVNFITAKPDLTGFRAAGEAEYGNYDAIKVKGMVNAAIGETIGVRVAGFYLKRDGYTTNLFDGRKIDDRDMYAVRGSLRFQPSDTTTIDLMGYYFRENDSRARIQKQLCQRDPTGVLGCLPGRREFGATNTNSTFTGVLLSREFLSIALGSPALGNAFGLGSLYGPDANANFVNPANVRQVRTDFNPEYFTDEQQYQARIEQEIGSVKLQLTGLYQKTRIESRQDYTLSVADRSGYATALGTLAAAAAGGVPGLPAAYFAPLASAIIPNGPAGNLCTSDTVPSGTGAFGGNSICAATPLDFDRSNARSRNWSVEGILTTDFDGPFNFLLGGIYVDAKTTNGDYYVNSFSIDYFTGLLGAFSTFPVGLPPSYLGSPFFRSASAVNTLKSYGIFGEAYWDISDKLKLTAGLRYNDDKKFVRQRTTLASFLVPYGTADFTTTPFGAQFDADPATPCLPGSPVGALGSVAGCEAFQVRNVSFSEFTGRVVLDYQITDDNLVYASYSRGYKSGGINPPLSPVFAVPENFKPEFVNAFEIGSKNTFANGKFRFNLTGFYYQYKDLQLSRITARTSVNDNIDADIYGVEAEAVIAPSRSLQANLGFSYLKTKVTTNDPFINQRDPSGGRSDVVIIKEISTNGAGSNCVVVPNTAGNAVGAQTLVTAVNTALGLRGPAPFPADSGLTATGAFGICSALAGAIAAPSAPLRALFGTPTGPLPFQFEPDLLRPGSFNLPSGVGTSIKGNSLPQAPNYKFSAGVQYTAFFDNGMTIVPRVDLTYTGESFGNIFNGKVNKVNGYAQANAQIQLNGADDRWFVRGFIQNIFDNSATTGLYVTDQSSGLFTNIFTLEPRRYGIAAGFKF